MIMNMHEVDGEPHKYSVISLHSMDPDIRSCTLELQNVPKVPDTCRLSPVMQPLGSTSVC